MQHIPKSSNECDAIAIIDRLLEDCWVDNMYLNANFETLSKPKYKKSFIAKLLEEQGYVCCYCMKMLDNDNHNTNDNRITLEHVVPHKCSPDEFDTYTSSEIRQNVIHKSRFDYRSNRRSNSSYPHDIAYHNLLASCDSRSHCNHHRGSLRIRELFYDVNISEKVEYDLFGNAYSQEYNSELEKLGISTNSELVYFRKLWSFFADIKENANEVNDDDIIDKVLEDVSLNGDSMLLDNLFGNPSRRKDFMQYKWFFNYYKSNN